jgi:hypothetical protein
MTNFNRVIPTVSIGRVLLATTLLVSVAVLGAAPTDLAGRWLGRIDSDRGEMEFGLELTEKNGKLEGAILTAHGDWPVTSVTEKEGLWTIAFKTESGAGQMSGRITDGTFSGKWDNSPMAVGTFSLARARKKS